MSQSGLIEFPMKDVSRWSNLHSSKIIWISCLVSVYVCLRLDMFRASVCAVSVSVWVLVMSAATLRMNWPLIKMCLDQRLSGVTRWSVMVPYGTSTWSPRFGQSICQSARSNGWGLIQCRAHKPSLFLSVTDERHRTRAQYLCDTIVPSANCWSVRLSLANGQTDCSKKKQKRAFISGNHFKNYRLHLHPDPDWQRKPAPC